MAEAARRAERAVSRLSCREDVGCACLCAWWEVLVAGFRAEKRDVSAECDWEDQGVCGGEE